MKNIYLSVIFLTTCLLYTMAEENSIDIQMEQEDSIDLRIASYGIEFNQFSTGSGFNPGFEATVFVKGKRGNKTLELGVYYDSESGRIVGISIHHKIMVFKKLLEGNSIFKPYLFYNFVYRSTTLDEPLTSKPELVRLLGVAGKSVYASMEHHFGVGVAIRIRSSVYFHGDIGYGGYLGSIKQPCKPNEYTGLIKGGNGWGIISKFGIGFEL